MKSEILEKEKAQEPVIVYPIFMIAEDGDVVWFTERKVGRVVYSVSGDYDLGYESTYWLMEYFKPFNGKVILSND